MAQTIIKEIASKKALQTYIDENKAQFKSILWPNFLKKKYTNKLTFDTLTGTRRAGVAGNVVAYNTSAPLHSRDTYGKVTGEIRPIRGKRKMDESQLLDYIIMSKAADADQQRLLDLAYDDVEFCSLAPHKRLDWYVAQMLSTGKITFDADNNAAGFSSITVDFQVPSANKSGTVGTVWSNAAGATPLADIREKIFKPLADKGMSGGILWMHPTKVWQLLESAEVLDKFGKLTDGKKTKVDLSLAEVNSYLAANNYPTIRQFNASIGLEKDGAVTYANPWSEHIVTYTPSMEVGTLHIGPIVEKERPQPQVTYAEFLDVLIKKFSDVDPVTEFTAFEMNAFPSLDIADDMFMINTNSVGSF